MSTWPKVSHTSSATRSASSRSPRSAAQNFDSGVLAWQSASTSSRRSLRRATSPTVTPRLARDRASDAPIPDEAPVTSAVVPCSSFIGYLTLASGCELLHGRQLFAVVLG